MYLISGCPTVNVPFYRNVTICSVMDRECLGVQCCINMDFTIAHLWIKTEFVLEPCNFQIVVGFENWIFNESLLTYKWGDWKYVSIGNYLSIR